MRYSLFLLQILSFLSCENEVNRSSSPTTNSAKILSETVIERDNKIQVTYSDLLGTIYEHGSYISLTDSCTFHYACDCCSGLYYFNDDSTFHYSSLCQSDKSYTIGKFEVESDKIILKYSGVWTIDKYNWEKDTDSMSTEYTYENTIMEPSTGAYSAKKCGDALSFRNDAEILLKSKDDYKSRFKELQSNGCVTRLDKLLETKNLRQEIGLPDQFSDWSFFELKDTIREDFDGDGKEDYAIFIKEHKKSGIIISHGETNRETKIGFGEKFAHIDEFNWVDYWGILNDKMTYEILIEDDEIIGDSSIRVDNPSIFVRKKEAGGGLITFKEGEYIWIHQAD